MSGFLEVRTNYKPGSVEIDHLSRPNVATRLKRLWQSKLDNLFRLPLAAGRVYLSSESPRQTVGFYPTRFTISKPG